MKFKKAIATKLPKLLGGALNLVSLVNNELAAKMALKIFCKPRGGKIKPYHQKYLNGFEHKFLEVDGEKIATYFRNIDAKETILMVHGWESNAARWKKLIKAIGHLPYNIVLMDGPAHGASGFDHFTGILYGKMIHTVSQHFSSSIVIGHSVGAFSTAYFLGNYTNNVKHFIILASPDTMLEISQQYFNVIGASKRLQSKYISNFMKWFGNPIEAYATSIFMANVTIPGILVHDRNDKINLYHNATDIAKVWKNGKLITTEGLDHSLQSNIVYDEIINYIQSISESKASNVLIGPSDVS